MQRIISYLGNNLNPFSNQVGRVEPHSKLANHGDVCSSLENKHTNMTSEREHDLDSIIVRPRELSNEDLHN